MAELLWMTPVFKETIWGGDCLHSSFQYEIPSDHTGECWAISSHKHGDCQISRGSYQGKTLSWLWKEHPELFGNYPGDRFPLLIKLIDAKEDLSIQVHPDDEYARIHENGSLGKTECWYILDCDEDATIVIGHHAKDQREMEEMIHNRRWKDFIRVIPIKKGDFFQIDPGCLHAIKGGTLLLETQQNSDVTYRVYDYDRLSDGKPRELHIKQSIATIRAPFVETKADMSREVLEGAIHTRFIQCPYYCVDKYDVNGDFTWDFHTPFTNVSIIDGTGNLNGLPLKKGDHFIIPHQYGICQFQGHFSMICSSPE